MKKYYDKILFFLGLAVLGIGAAIFVYKGGVPASSSVSLPSTKLTGSAFEPIPPPAIEDKATDWDAPPDQGQDRGDAGWTYSVFTPPKIWWETGQGWLATPPSGIGPRAAFGIELVDAHKELYRIQLLGTTGLGDASDLIDFSDEETGDTDLRLHVGDESTRAQFKVVSMKVEPVEEPHGVSERVAFVTILDERTNQTVDLRSDQAYSPTNNEYYLLKISAPYPDDDWKVTAVGDKHDLPDKGFFVVTALDFDKPSVTVEKHTFTKKGLEIVTKRELLKADQSAPSPEPAKPNGSAAKPTSPKSDAPAP